MARKKRRSNTSQVSETLRFVDVRAMVEEIYRSCSQQEAMLVGRHDLYWNFYSGNQWLNGHGNTNNDGIVAFVKDENGSTKTIWDFGYVTESRRNFEKNQVPQRVFNKIQPAIDQRVGYATSSQPQIQITNSDPSNQSEDFIRKTKHLNSFLQSVFNERFHSDYKRMRFETEIYGYSPLCIVYNPEVLLSADGSSTGENPFSIKKENVLNVVADPDAACWEDVRWVIKSVTMYKYEAVDLYGDNSCFDGYSPTAIVSLSELWIRQDVIHIDGDKNNWEMFITFNEKFDVNERRRLFNLKKGKDIKVGDIVAHFGRPLKNQSWEDDYEEDLSYPVLPIEVFRVNPDINSWIGESSVKPCIPHQYLINKQYSALDWKLTLSIFPPYEIDAQMMKDSASDGELIVSPGKAFPRNTTGIPPVKPIQTDLTTLGEIVSSMSVPNTGIEEATGMTQSIAGGNNPTGVYSASQLDNLQSTAMVGFTSSENDIQMSLKNLTRKLLNWAMTLVSTLDVPIVVYDSSEEKFVELTPDDFDIENYDIQIKTIDADFYSPASRIQVLIQSAQYNLLSPNDFLQSFNAIIPIFDEDKVRRAKEISELTDNLQIITLKAQEEEIMAKAKQQGQPQQAGGGQQPGMEQRAQQQPQGGQTQGGGQLEQGVQELAMTFQQTGVPTEYAKEFAQMMLQNTQGNEQLTSIALASVQAFVMMLESKRQQPQQGMQQQQPMQQGTAGMAGGGNPPMM